MTDENNKKLQYLKRGDVKTMEKDIGRLRERESEVTREKITKLRTGQELQEESERLERLKKAAEERGLMEAEAKRKEEELKMMREDREKRAASAEVTTAEKEESEKERLRAQFKEAQLKEEEERRRFLENIAAKAEGREPEEKPIPPPIPFRPTPPPPIPTRPVPPPLPQEPSEPLEPRVIPTPPPMPPPPVSPQVKPALPPAPQPPTPPQIKLAPPAPSPEITKKPFKFSLPKIQIPKIQIPRVQIPRVQVPKMQLPKVEGYFPAKPSLFEKIWIRIIISLFVIAILATLITFWYWYLTVRPNTPQIIIPAPPITTTPETTPEEEPTITQNLIGTGYHSPTTPRIIDTIIIHSGFNTPENPYDMEGIIQSYKKATVATHYLINREGSIFQLAPDDAIAYHAGIGKMPDSRTDINNFSLGISLVYQENEAPNDAQYQSLSWLVKELQNKYNIPSENILGYKDVAAGKTTPWNFDLDKLKLLLSSLPIGPDNGAEFILKNLTLEEKVGQLLIVGFDGLELSPELEYFMKTVSPGGVILFKKNIETPSQVKKLIQDLQKISLIQTGLPLFIAIDQEGGVISRISFAEEKTGQPGIKEEEEARKIGLKRGEELEELGINLNLAPVLDLTQTGDFLHKRSFQENSDKTGVLAKAVISGQKAAGILTAIKHFPGYGGITFNPEERLTSVTSTIEISQFQKAITANPELIMLASIIHPELDADLPIAFSAKGISFLKEKLGENPLIITDDLSQKTFLDNFPLEKIVTLPIEAGADILLFSGWEGKIKDASAALTKAAQNNDSLKELIDKPVLRIIKLKQELNQ